MLKILLKYGPITYYHLTYMYNQLIIEKNNNKTNDMINIKKVQDAREAIHNLLIYC